ncbi:disease resistance protein RPS6-like [Raphanus sativus]|uniref:ADP-ribosyl cyclase/cyclic ADP-ribose hydrolase n=1 Tax=Raphanus sativus TaxID=3726 RepID=A0A9W3BXI5_RAPSA|nr:disease resistance protein RPS6-like [Raphanus sativus]
MALSSSSSSSSRTWLYDVFPSFSGEDVRVTFLSHFLKELDRKLIIAFKDSEIQRSQSLDPKLKQAIRDSRIAVVIISKNYASSRWCLNELLEIVKCREECGQMVIPVFYGLGASHVRKQTGEFGQIFEETCQDETEEGIIQWRRALTDVANTLGYHSVNWDNEAKMIEEIVSDVLDKLLLTSSKDSEDFVGIEYHIAKLSVLLQLEDEQVRMVGLWGSSGVGKTTIARVLFQRFSRHFQSSIFIDRAFLSKSMEIYSKANPDDYNMKLHLQGHFLSKILGKGDIKINHLSAIWERLKHHKVLIFIDDLDDQVVLDALVGQPQWFGSGSRIILVTNDKHFLRGHGVDHIYEVCLPSEDLAREMLCRSAFKKTTAPEDFKELVFKVAQLAGRLPLGLSVLGSSLRGRDKEYWMDLLSRLQNGIDEKIEQTLRVSYDELRSEEDKKIFRYIACFFNGAQVTNMKLLLGESDMSVNLGLKNLADRSLIHVREGHVEMHCLLQEMGKKVVRLEKPEKREFLVDSQDTCDVLSEGIGTQNVIGILLDLDEIDELHIHENAFTGMRNLRFLKIYSKLGLYREVKCQLPENFDYFPPKLKLLRWDNYRMRCMPSKFRPENLVKFEMRYSKLEKLWEGVVSLPCLKEMDLRYSYHLIEMPDLSKATNLETLTLKNCYSLVKLPSSIPHPNKLKKLDMICCQNLETIPIGISLKSVEQLFLGGCSRLRTFPQISTNILHLTIDKTSIEELPSNLNLENIYCLSMTKLKSKKLWERVQPLTSIVAMLSPSLESLYLSDISTLVELPSSFQNLYQLQRLKIRNCVNLETLPTGIDLKYLYHLDLSGCSRLKTFPGISTNLTKLCLSETGIEEIPLWIKTFYRLESLEMDGCNNLGYVYLNFCKHEHGLYVNFSHCKALTGVGWSDSPRRDNIYLDFTNCSNLDQEALFQQKTYFQSQLRLSGEEVPSYFTHRTTGTFSLSIPLLPTSLSQPFLRFRVCIVFNDNMSEIDAECRFTGSFWNSSDSYDQAQYFCADTEDYTIFLYKKDSCLFILDCQMSHIPLEMNFDHVDLEIHFNGSSDMEIDIKDSFGSLIDIKEWGIRIIEEDFSAADNRLGNPDILPHVFEANESNMINEVGEGEECAGEDEVTEARSKRMRTS